MASADNSFFGQGSSVLRPLGNNPYSAQNLTFDFSDDPYLQKVGWGGAARETKNDYLQNQINKTLGAGYGEAQRVGAEAESRGAKAEQTMTDAYNASKRPSLSMEDINRLLTESGDASAKSFLGNIGSLRSYLGGAGITGGGLAGGLATGAELQRLGQITDAKRGLMIEKARLDAQDLARNFNNAQSLATFQNRPVDTTVMDFLGDVTGIRLGQQGVLAELSAAKDQASASRSSGLLQGIGGIATGALGALA